MDSNERKRSSKWDLPDSQMKLEGNGQENVRSGIYHASPDETKSYSGRHSSAYAADIDGQYPIDAKNSRSKYEHAVSARDYSSANRVTDRDNNVDRGNRGYSEATIHLDDKVSRRDYDHSPRNSLKRQHRSDYIRGTSRGRSRSRSRSRSPIRAYKHESRANDRPRSKLEVPIQTCRDFTSGRCRRGSHCSFLHPSTQNYEERRYDLKHWDESTRGGKYSHRNASDGYHNDHNDKTLEPRIDYDRYRREDSFNHGAENAHRQSSDVPCTFFAAGYCRNGNNCNFSHQIPLPRKYEGGVHDPEKVRQMNLDSKFSDTVDHQAAEYGKERWQTHRSDKVDQNNQGGEFLTTVDPHVEYGRESHGKDVSLQSRSNPHSLPMPTGWGNNIESSYVTHNGLTTVDKAVKVKANQSSHWNTGNLGNVTTISDAKAVVNWIGDKMSPEWNPKVSSTRIVTKEESNNVVQPSEAICHNGPPQSSQLTHYASSVMPPVVEEHNFKQSVNLIHEAGSAFSYERNIGGNIASNINRSFLSDNSANLSSQNIMNGAPGNFNAGGVGQFPPANDGATPCSKVDSQGQLAQLTDLSVSLAHLLGKSQQLPQFYAAMNPTNPKTSINISDGNTSQFPVVTTQPYPPNGSINPYEPVCDDAGQMQPNSSIILSQYPPNPGALRTTEDVKQEMPSEEQNEREAYIYGCSKGNLSLEPDSDAIAVQKPQTVHKEATKGEEKHAKSREGSLLENVERDVKDGGKKLKDAKALRDFKHALVNFLKDMLKPAWTDGKIDKDGFKTIVKKATDKVNATIQEASIPQTPEKIEQYLSASKPKLKKLLQAYVDRNQKKQT